MTLSRALALTLALVMAGLTEAAAQFPPPPGQTQQPNPFPPPSGQAQQANPFPPPPGQTQQSNPFPLPPGQSGAAPRQSNPFPAAPSQASQSPARPGAFPPPGGGPNICEQFPSLRTQAEKDANAIKAASDRKAAREEICALFVRFAGSEGKMTKFLETNQAACGVPPEAIKQVKTQHARTLQIRKNVCATGGGGGGAPRAPSLSDALGGPLVTDEPPKPGRGTFDTLTGSPLAR